MANNIGTTISDTIVTFDDRDIFPTHTDTFGRGGLMIFTNFDLLTSQSTLGFQTFGSKEPVTLPPDTPLRPNLRRKIGQIIYVQDIQRYYQVMSLTGNLSSSNTLVGMFPIKYSSGIFSTNIEIATPGINKMFLPGVSNSTIFGSNITAGDSFTVYVNNLNATDHIQAKTKSFSVEHPTKPGKKLNYGSLESPYHGIRLTGIGLIKNGQCIVKLPEYVSKFVQKHGINIQLTNYGHSKPLYVERIDVTKNQFLVKLDGFLNKFSEYEFFWTFTAVRKDVPNLIVED
jgi:hypothetical protein